MLFLPQTSDQLSDIAALVHAPIELSPPAKTHHCDCVKVRSSSSQQSKSKDKRKKDSSHKSKSAKKFSQDSGSPLEKYTRAPLQDSTHSRSLLAPNRHNMAKSSTRQSSGGRKNKPEDPQNSDGQRVRQLEAQLAALQNSLNAKEEEVKAEQKKYNTLVNMKTAVKTTGRGAKIPKDQRDLIREIVRHYVFRTIKFVSEESKKKKACMITMEHLADNELNAPGVEGDARRIQWIQKYGSYVKKCVNDAKSYVQGRLKESIKEFMEDKGRSLPTTDQILACATRTCTESDPDLFEWYWVHALGILGFKKWKKQVWLFDPPSTAKFNDCGKMVKFFPTSSEAFLVLAFDNNQEKWPAIWKLKEEKGKDALIDPKDKKYWGKYTPPNGGKCLFFCALVSNSVVHNGIILGFVLQNSVVDRTFRRSRLE